MSSLECVSTTMVALDFDITLVAILGFWALVSTTYTFKDLVLSSTIDLTSKYR